MYLYEIGNANGLTDLDFINVYNIKGSDKVTELTKDFDVSKVDNSKSYVVFSESVELDSNTIFPIIYSHSELNDLLPNRYIIENFTRRKLRGQIAYVLSIVLAMEISFATSGNSGYEIPYTIVNKIIAARSSLTGVIQFASELSMGGYSEEDVIRIIEVLNTKKLLDRELTKDDILIINSMFRLARMFWRKNK